MAAARPVEGRDLALRDVERVEVARAGRRLGPERRARALGVGERQPEVDLAVLMAVLSVAVLAALKDGRTASGNGAGQ